MFDNPRHGRNSPTVTTLATDNIITVRSLDFAYTDQLVLKHIDLDIPAGSTLGLIGPNGGGKTTLIRLLVGILRPTRGTIMLRGLPIAQALRRRGVVGYLPQRAQLNIAMPLSLQQLLWICTESADHRHCAYLLDAVGLADLADRPIGTLSGGQLQRLLIARALVCSPSLLVLDEPTTGIDASSREQFVKLMMRLKQDLNLTVLLSSHDLPTIQEVCDHVACVNVTVHVHTRPPHPTSADACGFPAAPPPQSNRE